VRGNRRGRNLPWKIPPLADRTEAFVQEDERRLGAVDPFVSSEWPATSRKASPERITLESPHF
jgi:hypothetical protein